MKNRHELQELGISQIQVIHRFFDLKIEVLFAVLRSGDSDRLIEIQEAIGAVDRILARLFTHLQPRAREGSAARTLRLRGCDALTREAGCAIRAAREKVAALPDHISPQHYTRGEQEAIIVLAESLCSILDSDLYLVSGGSI